MEAGRRTRLNGHAPSFEAARFHFRQLEAAFERVREAELDGGSGTAEREAFLDQMHLFRRHAQQVVVESHEILERHRRAGVEGARKTPIRPGSEGSGTRRPPARPGHPA